jgi:cell pole-organizing protein PopZ
MSGSRSQLSGALPSGVQSEGSASGADPSMEDILASIRRILSEEDLPPDLPVAKVQEPPEPEPPDVLVLDTSMLVVAAQPALEPEAEPEPEPEEIAPRKFVVGRSPLPPAPPVTMPVAEAPAEMPAAVATEAIPEDVVFSAPAPAPVMPAAFIEPAPKAEAEQPPRAEVEPPAPPSLPVDLVPPMMKTEPSMQPEAIPALTPGSIAKMVPPPPIVNRPAMSPILMPVPLSGQNPSPPLINRPAALAKASVFTAPLPAAPDIPPAVAIPPAPLAEPRQDASPTTLPETETSPMSASLSSGLASNETTNAAAGSVTNLVRALTSDRSAQLHTGGPTIADLVREELRPVIKAWLDSNLPPLVERMVRAEIERVISRAQA